MKKQTSRVKGFTLIELIIVLAIIGILAGILMPTMSAYYTRSRLKSANANAKMVYNTTQTMVQKYINRDRTATATEVSPFGGQVLLSYNGETGAVSHSTAFPGNLTVTDATNTVFWEVAQDVNVTVSNAQNMSWTVYINNYIVQGCVAADHPTTNLVGCFSANRTMSTERSTRTYEQWVTMDDASGESLRWVCSQYGP